MQKGNAEKNKLFIDFGRNKSSKTHIFPKISMKEDFSHEISGWFWENSIHWGSTKHKQKNKKNANNFKKILIFLWTLNFFANFLLAEFFSTDRPLHSWVSTH